MSKLYVITFKENKEMITPDSIKKYWKNYGSAAGSGLYGWKPPKKVYFTLGQARRGFSFIPDQLKSQCEISIYTFSESVQDGEVLKAEQKTAKEKRELKAKIRDIEWEISVLLRQVTESKERKKRVEILTKQLEELKKST